MNTLRFLKNNAGHVLIMAVVMARVLAIMAGAFLQMSGTEATSASLQNDSTRAFYHAEVGLEYAVGSLKRGGDGTTFVGPFACVDGAAVEFTPDGAVAGGNADHAGSFDIEALKVNVPCEDANGKPALACSPARTSCSTTAPIRRGVPTS